MHRSWAPRRLGSTGRTVTPIGLGLAALGRPGYINLGREHDIDDRTVDAMKQRCHEMLDAAYAGGIRYVDAARSYGFAESFLASWLDARGLPDGAVTIGSKWGYTYTGGWRFDAAVHEVKDLSVDALRRQVAETRATLGNRLHLYQVHSATLESGVLEDRAVLEDLLRLSSEGIAVGITTTGPRQAETIRRALAVRVDGANPFQCVQATWNLLEPSAGPALVEAHRSGWGVIVKEVLANGRLTDRAARNELPAALRDFVRSRGIGLDALAFAAALGNPWVDVVLAGAVTREQLESNLQALHIDPPLDDLLRVAPEPAERYWTRRGALPWT